MKYAVNTPRDITAKLPGARASALFVVLLAALIGLLLGPSTPLSRPCKQKKYLTSNLPLSPGDVARAQASK